jgi:RHH-type proline utilization regulon transcriptional repressor/proline dehydrogenase/delta 1-pyrroline-5-carboxylate dehydrogenase
VTDDVRREASELAEQFGRLAAHHGATRFRPEWWNEQLLAWSVSHPSFKTQLFRFVDVFPATRDDVDVLHHLEEYLEEAKLPKMLDLAVSVTEQLPFASTVSAALARRMIARMAEQFIAGPNASEAMRRLEELWRDGTAFTVDVLGEKTVASTDSDRYLQLLDGLLSVLLHESSHWPAARALESDDLGAIPRVNVSVKPTALSSRYLPLTGEDGLVEVRKRLVPVLAKASDGAALVHVDTEQYEVKDLTIELVSRLLTEPDLQDHHLGVTVQSYLTDSYEDLEQLIALSAAHRTPLTIRLVKGAYWDTETIQAVAAGWPVPVFTEKSATDSNFERCARLLHDHHGEVRAAFGTHHLPSIAYAIAYARGIGIPDNGYEVQTLFGMGESLHYAVRELGFRLRAYSPVGNLVPGMAYLVRRLLENTSNETFVRAHLRGGGHTADKRPRLVPPRAETEQPGQAEENGGASLPYSPEPLSMWHRRTARAGFAAELDRMQRVGCGIAVPAWIDGVARYTNKSIDSVDPAKPDRIVASSADCGSAEADEAVDVASRAFDSWRRTPADERAAVLFRTAQWFRAHRAELAALEVLEAGKPWGEADADVCEAIDYCQYYGREMLQYSKGALVQSPPGEKNSMHYAPRGVVAVISPWNFPLAIPTGMVTAALVTGNTVILKPAEQTPAVAAKLAEALEASGLPRGVLSFLPGRGEVVGAHLVAHAAVASVAFTGSKAVGLDIIAQAAVHRDGQRQLKRVIAEMGGKNALVVDSDADLDQAVPITVASAFSYSGQKCSAASRVIVVGDIYERFLERLVSAASDLRIGHPIDPAVQIGPLIDDEALRRVRGYADHGSQSGEVLLRREDLPGEGWFFGPTIVGDVRPGSPIETDEIFGPVLAVMRAPSLEEAVAIANDTPYALTAGIVSRSPAHIRYAATELRAGNVYVNRSITGAVVGRQPFGGYGLSGSGSKAGGPGYLAQFLEPRVVSENTVRRGSAPSDEHPSGVTTLG